MQINGLAEYGGHNETTIGMVGSPCVTASWTPAYPPPAGVHAFFGARMPAETSVALKGLTSIEVKQRLLQFGPNELPMAGKRDLARIAADALSEPLLALLLAASGLYFVIGDTYDAILLLGLGVLNIGLVVFQEHKTERTLEALRDLSSPRALVIRDGTRQRIAGRDVVPDDLLVLTEGDRVAADAALLAGAQLTADESLLTGESVPVRKTEAKADATAPERPGGDDLPWVFSGSLIVSGHGIARVARTGAATEMGRIGRSLTGLESEKTRLHKVTGVLTRNAAICGVAVSLVVTILHGLQSSDWIAAALAGVTIAMSMLPEEIPVVLTVFLTLGAWRIARHRVLARRAAAIETLGAATVLCTDKTGTLTINRMSVAEFWRAGLSYRVAAGSELPDEALRLAQTARLACDPHATDPMEQAFHRLVGGLHPAPAYRLVNEYGLRRDLLAVGYVWRRDQDRGLIVAAKGAPEAIIDLCGLDPAQRSIVLKQVGNMAARGLRVLGIAEARYDGDPPDTLRGFAFQFRGLAGLEDPVRDTVPAAVASCRGAGIQVIMITGDYPATAMAIATKAGIDTAGGVIAGAELAAMPDSQLVDRLRSVRVFARIMPEQKLQLVRVLKSMGEIVAMTGDGVNDAPALKAAHIGIAMGGRGTDVAREASGLVLLDDAFESIATAIQLGRRIFDNLRKALSYILAVHLPIAGLAIAPLLAGWPIVFFPIHVVFLEFVIDPICSVVFEAEPEEPEIMERPPRAPDAPLFGLREVAFSVLQGLVGLAAVLGALGLSLADGAGEAEARTITFVTLVTVNIALVFSNRSWNHPAYQSLSKHNSALWLVLVVTIAVLAGAILTPFGTSVFRFAPLQQDQLGLAIGAAAVSFLVIELLKLARYVTRHGWPQARNSRLPAVL